MAFRARKVSGAFEKRAPDRGHSLCCVLGQDTLLSRCLSPPRCINGPVPANLKGLGQPPLFSMTSKFLIKHGEANSYCFTVSCVPEGMFNYLE